MNAMCFRKKEKGAGGASKRDYASLSSIAGILLNLLLCTAKLVTGTISRSAAISADGFNNLSDAGISLVTLLGFQVARYGRGNLHSFGHGRFEWIMGMFASLAVAAMGVRLIQASFRSIASSQGPVFSAGAAIVLTLSILVKGFMYVYNRRFAKLTNSETLKAAAADCISDAAATGAVLLSAAAGYVTGWQIDGYCGALVSGFIVFTGIKSLWDVLGRIMGRTAGQDVAGDVLRIAEAYPEIKAVRDLMAHDYGFGHFVISLRVEGYRSDSERIYSAVHEISYALYRQFRCDCFLQVDYLADDHALAARLLNKVERTLEKYGGTAGADHFRLTEGGGPITAEFDLLYPAGLQKSEEAICQELEAALAEEEPRCRAVIRSILRRERYGSGCRNKFNHQEDHK